MRAILLAAMLAASTAQAAELRIGTVGTPTSLDPHYHNVWINVALTLHIFDRLIGQDAQQHLVPSLATSWRSVDDLTWEIRLRDGVRFQDGGAFTADDVVFTLQRIPKVPNSPSSFNIYTSNIVGHEVIDAHTIRLKTARPYPLLPVDLSLFAIMGRKQSGGPAPEGKTTAQLNAGDGVIGTGPYRYVEFVQGDHATVARNPDYWGGAEPWERVTFKPIPVSGARTAALLSGAVDLIDNAPIADLPRLRGNPAFAIFEGPTNQVMYLAMDSFAEPSPGISGTDGRNPLKDPRIRRALSLAINRDAIIERVLDGLARPAAEFAPPGFFGTTPDMKPDPYDPDTAARLVKEAGYPNGFALVLGTASDRPENAAQMAQAIAGMWTRIGVRTQVDASPINNFYGKRNRFEFSAYMTDALSYTGEASFLMKALVATPNPQTGYGVINKGRYSNPEFDAVLTDALATIDDAARSRKLQQASRMVMQDHGMLVIEQPLLAWAARKGITYTPAAGHQHAGDVGQTRRLTGRRNRNNCQRRSGSISQGGSQDCRAGVADQALHSTCGTTSSAQVNSIVPAASPQAALGRVQLSSMLRQPLSLLPPSSQAV